MWISEEDAKNMGVNDLLVYAVRAALRRIANDTNSLGRETDVELIKVFFK